MLQSNLNEFPVQITVFSPSTNAGEIAVPVQPMAAPCPTTAKLLKLFEEITGWKVEFHESNASLQRRKASNSKSEPAKGEFSIVDMSEHWPAQKPTCHRGKCDQFIALFDRLVGDHQSVDDELNKIQSALLAFDANARIKDDIVSDSFVPKFGSGLDSDTEFTVSDGTGNPVLSDKDFEIDQDVSGTSSLVSPPFEGWSLGGATGIVGNYYLDWRVDNDEQIAICAGEIDVNSPEESESVILIDPLTEEYRLVSSAIEQDGMDHAHAFKLWDGKTLTLSAIVPNAEWRRLKPHQAIIATTANESIEGWPSALATQFGGEPEQEAESGVSMDGCRQEVPCDPMDAWYVTANELAEILFQTPGATDPLLVLKRIQ